MSIPAPAALARHQVTWPIGWAGSTPGPLAGASGHIAFEASATVIAYSDATVLPEPVITPVIGGVMVPVDLIENDVDVWNWRVTPRLGVAWEPFHINVDGPVNIASAATTPGKGPVRVVKGDRGAQGASLASLEQVSDDKLRAVIEDPLTGGTEVAEFTLPEGPVGPPNSLSIGTVKDGPTPSATIRGDAPSQSLDLVLRRGEQGLPGVNAVPADEAVATYVVSTSKTQTALDTGYRRGVSVREYGATGDGVTDDTGAFTAALASGRTVHVPEGDYVVSGATATGPVDMVLEAGATLHHLATGAALHITGTAGTPVPLSVDAALGARAVAAPGHSVGAGDWIRVGSDRLYDASSTRIRIGEMVEVASVDGDVLSLVTPLQGGPYTVPEGASVTPLDMVEGVKIQGAGVIRGAYTPDLSQTGIRVTLARHVQISGITTQGIDYRHIAPEDTVDTVISGTSHEWARSSGMGYTIALTNAAQDTLIQGVSFRDVRHAFTTSNQAAIAGIVRRATVRDCTVRFSAPAVGGSPGDAFDTHTASEDIVFESNTIIGATGLGINMEGRSGRIVGNTIIRPQGGGISFHNESDQPGSVEISGNIVVASGHYAIRVSPPTRGSTAVNRGIIVSGNVVKDNPVNPIMIGSTTGTTLHAVTVLGNVSINSGTSRMITVDNASVVHSSGNVADSSASAVIIDDRNPTVADDPGFTIRTIAGGAVAITPSTRYLRLGSTAGDELRNITGGSRGQIVTVRLSSGTATVPITTGSGSNIGLSAAMTLAGGNDTLTLGFTGSSWIEVSRTKF